jgi:pimeloyl-ACP methyl ester carboxylesterase
VKRLTTAFVILLALALTANAQGIQLKGVGSKGRVNTPKTKNIHGAVLDQSGKPIPGAHVLVLNTKDNTSRTLTTDESGNYSIDGLKPDVNYEVRADFKGVVSDRKSISSFLDREDNLINFQLNLTAATASAGSADTGPQLQTFDLVKLKASFEMPSSVPAPIPAVLLLHGYGENRKVWETLRKQFLNHGWAVMTLDLRGHGDSTSKNQRTIEPSPDWRTNPREFPQDIDPALDWLKKQPRLNSRKIVIVGYDVGANLALVSSGKFSEVRTIIAVNPNLNESLALAGSAQDFRPHSALVVTATQSDADAIKPYVKDPVRLLTQPVAGGTAKVFEEKTLTDAVFQWLKETY